MFYLNFVSPQVKRSVIVGYTLGIYELLLELFEQPKTQDLKKLGNTTKILKLHRIIA